MCTVPLPSIFVELLKNELIARKGSLYDYIFTQQTTSNLHTHSSYTKMWDRWYKDFINKMEQKGKEVGAEKITAKMLRHTYGTMLFEHNIPDLVVQSVMGHSDVAFTRSVYTHLRKEFSQEQSNAIRKIF